MSVATIDPTDPSGPSSGSASHIVEPDASLPPPKPKKPFGIFFWMCGGWLTLIAICAVVGKRMPFVKHSPDYAASAVFSTGHWTDMFSKTHPLGLDRNGNDWLTAAILGARNSVIIAFATVLFGFILGGGLGMLAGYTRGKFDTVMSFIATVLLSVPPLLFIILLITLLSAGTNAAGVEQGLDTSVWKLSLSLGILSIPTLFRVVRASTMQFASREFVLAARAMGASTPRILLREILPNVVKPMIAFGLVAAGSVMVIEGGLSYLGIGVGNAWAWGKMIQSGAGIVVLKKAPNIAFIPAAILFTTVLSFNLMGDKLRERLEVKQGGI